MFKVDRDIYPFGRATAAIRTQDSYIKSVVLYRLSYGSMCQPNRPRFSVVVVGRRIYMSSLFIVSRTRFCGLGTALQYRLYHKVSLHIYSQGG